MAAPQPRNRLALYAAVGAAGAVASAIALYVTREGGGVDSAVRERLVGPEQARMAQAQMAQLATALQVYQLNAGKYPSASAGLLALVADGAVTESQLRDPWGAMFLYSVTPDGGFEIRSAGPNAIPGDEDDVLQP